MANYFNNALNDPFGSLLFSALDKLEVKNYIFNTDTRIDVFADQQGIKDYLPLLYFKNRWLSDQLETEEMDIYKDNNQVTSAVIMTGNQH